MLQRLRSFVHAKALPVAVQALICSLLALALTQVGYFASVQAALSDRVTFAGKVPTSGTYILVVADKSTLKATGKFPYDRRLLADTLDRLREAGAERVYLDAALNSPEDPAGDARLAEAIQAFTPGRLALPTNPPGGPREVFVPLESFRVGATFVTTDFKIDPDRRSRRIASFMSEAPSAADWLAQHKRPADESILVDLRYDPATLPKYEMREVAAGRVGRDQLAGRRVVIGLDLPSTAMTVVVPKYSLMGRLAFIALGAETVSADHEFMPYGAVESIAISLLLTLAGAPFLMRLGVWRGLSLFIALTFVWFRDLGSLQADLGHLLPPLCPPMAVFLEWLLLLVRENRSVAKLRSRLSNMAGVGRNALIAAVEAITEPACVLDRAGHIVGANEEFATLMQATYARGPAQQIAAHIEKVSCGSHADPSSSNARAARFDLSLDRTDSSAALIFDTRVRWIDTLAGRCAIATLTDVTEMRNREGMLRTLAYNDALTGLGNRLAFQQGLARIRVYDGSEPSALALIDLDGFKQVNDTLGHHIGDLLLVAVAATLRDVTGGFGEIARLGGDEFAVILHDANASAGARFAETLLLRLRMPFEIEGHFVSVGASIGIALLPEHTRDTHEAVSLADAAMYRAKKSKPGYRFHADDQLKRAG